MFLKILPFHSLAAAILSMNNDRSNIIHARKSISRDEIIRRGRLLTRQQEPMSRKAKAKMRARLSNTIVN